MLADQLKAKTKVRKIVKNRLYPVPMSSIDSKEIPGEDQTTLQNYYRVPIVKS